MRGLIKRFIFLLLWVSAGVYFSARAHADNCFIDGANVPRCAFIGGSNHYVGVSWPVFTAETPLEVWNESLTRWSRESGDNTVSILEHIPTVQHVRLDTPEHYPDVVCFDFYHAGIKVGQTCFDTMEITER